MAQVVVSLAHTRQGAPAEGDMQSSAKDWPLHKPVVDIDKRDHGSPDDWVPRHPDLIRLTGRHPFNCEPPLHDLMQHGFITPVSLHYVRNHGPAPQLEWASHRITIDGLVDKPVTLSMEDIMALPTVTLPVTLVCAGNRRKEENMLKKSIGFNWGPSAVSTTYWTGVRMSDVLNLANVSAAAQYVCFAGPTKELPKGKDGSYGTSLLLSYAMNEANDVILAYKQNDRWLTPDHGFPIRMIIPGFIGGRMVKWLKTITLTAQESDNHYHYFDNRVLPPHVDEALATKEGWWYKPDYIINELNINSAIAKPAHDETLPLDSNQPYTMQGYAYTGGGRKIIRIEVSLDDAKTWQQAEIHRHEQPTKHGRYWCWIHWSFQVHTADMLGCKELLVRAWDSSQNGQPAVITWNVMGMMNNCYFRVRVLPQKDSNGKLCLRFQHPAPIYPGQSGLRGWREEESAIAPPPAAADAPAQAAIAAAAAAAPRAADKVFTMEEVEQHDTEESCWFVHEGKVYDATPFLQDHPGGADSILLAAGQDATVEFNSIHSQKARDMLKPYCIGVLAAEGVAATPAALPEPPKTPPQQPEPTANGHAPTPSITLPSANGSLINGSLANGTLANGTSTLANGNGTISPTISPASHPLPPTPSPAPPTDLVALNPKKKIPFALAEKVVLNHNTCLFRFALQSPQHRFGLPVGKHIFLYATVDGEPIMRAYTPTTSDDQLGHFDLVVKIYRPNIHPRFPNGGKMSQHLDALPIGATIEVKGPVGHFVYLGRGKYSSHGHEAHATQLNFIAGGTGLTPCYSVIKAVLRDADDTTQLSLLYANNTPDDILLQEELDALAAKHSNFRVWYTVATAPEGWQYSTGFVSLEMLQERMLPFEGGTTLACMCGPPPMLQYACVPNLEKMGYGADDMVTF